MNKFIRILMVSMCCIAVLFLVGCGQDEIIETTQQIDPRIVEMVAEVTDDPVLQHAMQEEILFLTRPGNSRDIKEIEHIVWDPMKQDFFYMYDYDFIIDRYRVQEEMEEDKQGDEISLRTHYRQNYLVDDGAITLYVYYTVSTAWKNALYDAYDEFNDLNLDISFGAVTTSNPNPPSGATLISYMDLMGEVAGTGNVTSGGDPAPYLRIDPDYEYLSASQKKEVMAHELGHVIGLKHTDGGSGTAIYNGCVSSTCKYSSDPSSVFKEGETPVRSWNGFSSCDEDVLDCLFGDRGFV